MEVLINRFEELAIQVDQSLMTDLKATFQLEKIDKRTKILEENRHCRRLYFLEKGIIRSYYEHNLEEVTSWVYNEGQFVSSWHSFYLQRKSFETLEALEDCICYSISFANYQKLMDKHHGFERFARFIAESQIAHLDLFYKGFMIMSSKERYQQLLRYFPDIELRVQIGYIASLLGISRETLSRIRSEVKKL